MTIVGSTIATASGMLGGLVKEVALFMGKAESESERAEMPPAPG
jgi:hypothetical protein